MQYNTSLGTCAIIFGPEIDDLGQWSCTFTINDWEIASATLVLLTTPPGKGISSHDLALSASCFRYSAAHYIHCSCPKIMIFCGIRGFHRGEYEDNCLLGCSNVQSGRHFPVLQRSL